MCGKKSRTEVISKIIISPYKLQNIFNNKNKNSFVLVSYQNSIHFSPYKVNLVDNVDHNLWGWFIDEISNKKESNTGLHGIKYVQVVVEMIKYYLIIYIKYTYQLFCETFYTLIFNIFVSIYLLFYDNILYWKYKS